MNKNFKIISSFLFFLILANNISAQDNNQEKAKLLFAILERTEYKNEPAKKDFLIATLDCPKGFTKKLKAERRKRLFNGINAKIEEFNQADLALYDVIVVSESQTARANQLFDKVLQTSKEQNKGILIFTENNTKKEKILFNFTSSPNSEVIDFEYFSDNLTKFNLKPKMSMRYLNGTDISTQKMLEKIQEGIDTLTDKVIASNSELQAIDTAIKHNEDIIKTQDDKIFDQQALLENILTEMDTLGTKLSAQQEAFEEKELELLVQKKLVKSYRIKTKNMKLELEEQTKSLNDRKEENTSLAMKNTKLYDANSKLAKLIETNKKELKLTKNIVKLQKIAIISVGSLLFIIVLLSFWIFRNYKKQKRISKILEKRNAQIEYQKQILEKLSIVASNTTNAVSILNNQGNFEWINDSFTKMYGYTFDLLQKELDINIKKMPLYSGILESFTTTLEQKTSQTERHKVCSRSNDYIWIHSNITPILDPDNNIKQIIIVDTDISAVKEAELQIAEKNKDIENSILYASRLQIATLPPVKTFKSYLPNSFILYQPRDIVSGDFYWSYKIKDKILFSAADCTGHGVPGAFMSILGVTLFNETVTSLKYNDITPGTILNNLREKLIIALQQDEITIDEYSTIDGIDLSLCMLDTKTKELSYSAANNPIVHIKEGVLNDYEADEMPIGISMNNKYKDFCDKKIDYKSGDMLYLFSDGYADQFSRKQGRLKKFMSANLQKLFLEIHKKSLKEQKEILIEKHLDWKGDYKQVDDILIIGVRLS